MHARPLGRGLASSQFEGAAIDAATNNEGMVFFIMGLTICLAG
jgi:hypothetical protein